jgi:VWFA-related protein
MQPRPLVVFALLAAGSSVLAAGNPQQPPQTFRSGAQIVQVDVRVLKDGNFVTGLTPADFEIKEDGVSQKIESVVLIAPSLPSLPSPPSVPSAPSRPSPPSSPSVWVFVFDTEHLSPGGLNRSREAVVTFIRDRLPKGDVGGIVFDGRMANNRLTSDHEELRTAAAAVKMPGELRSRQLELHEWPRLQDDEEVWAIAQGDRQALAAAVRRACNEDADACRRVSPDEQIIEKSKFLNSQTQLASLKTLKAAQALSGGLARMPGAKTIVFLSEGFFINDQIAELRQAVGMAARAGAHFYTIDARGLNKGSASAEMFDQAVVSGNFGQQQKFDTQSDGMNSLAIDTGGFAIRNENNFARALDEIQQDAGTYYVVSYAASNSVFDGKYRSIEVAVGRPGVKVRARRGYLALEPTALLRPTQPAVPTASKPASDSEPATASAPELPVSPGLVAIDASVPVATGAPAAGGSHAAAVRSRIDGGKMVAALGRSGASESSDADAGWAAYQRGDVAGASVRLDAAAKAPDARPWVHYALGLAQFAQQRYKEAASAWERVARDVPQFEPIYFCLADAYGLQHDEGTAIKILREAEQRWPTDPEVFDAIGVLQVKRGAVDAAIDSFAHATEIAPAESLGYFNLGRTLQMRLLKVQRYDRQMEKWIGGESDRKRAIAAFQKYLELGGPYESPAREALTALGWK